MMASCGGKKLLAGGTQPGTAAYAGTCPTKSVVQGHPDRSEVLTVVLHDRGKFTAYQAERRPPAKAMTRRLRSLTPLSGPWGTGLSLRGCRARDTYPKQEQPSEVQRQLQRWRGEVLASIANAVAAPQDEPR